MAANKRKRLVLIDGYGLAYRMYFAIQAAMSTRQGEADQRTYGFTRTPLEALGWGGACG